MKLRDLLASCLILLCLNSQAQTVVESMALFDEGKTSEAIAQLNKLGQGGNADAQNMLGVLYDNGQGVAQDYKLARIWFEKAAAQGHASAQYHLGFMYEAGRGVAHSDKQAWFARAAAQGDPHAQRQLGTLYAKGLGVTQNKILAYMWLDIARGLGEQSAVRTLAELSETMSKEAVTRARELATRCIAKSYQDCDAAT